MSSEGRRPELCLSGRSSCIKRDELFNKAGETVAIIGLSGWLNDTVPVSGIAPHVLSGSMQGRVLIRAGDDRLQVSQLASEIGMVFRIPDVQLVTTTVEDEIAFAGESADHLRR